MLEPWAEISERLRRNGLTRIPRELMLRGGLHISQEADPSRTLSLPAVNKDERVIAF